MKEKTKNNSFENDVDLSYLFTYFSNLNTIKMLKQKQKNLIPVKYIDVENKFDSNLKIADLKSYCTDFYKNVLFYLPIYEIYILKLRFQKELPFDECEKILGVKCGNYDCQKSLKHYKSKLIPWLLKAEVQSNRKAECYTKQSLR